ncbi:MAG TPA: PilZ domain-containing protein [bacterium]|nr:PilZ domain-containing protein [bacterium]
MKDGKNKTERRAEPRIPIKIPVKYLQEDDKAVLKTIAEWRNTKKHGYTLDVSLGGMSVVVDQYLQVGTILNFDLFLLDSVSVATLYAEVRWVSQKSAGLRFLLMKEKELEALRAFLMKSKAHKA